MVSKFEIVLKTDNRKEIERILAERITDGLELCGQQAERNAKINLEQNPRRIDTGLLRNSVTHALAGKGPDKTQYSGDNPSHYNDSGVIPHGSYSGTTPNDPPDTVYLGTNVEYALEVHEGTVRMAPNRFIRNAMSDHVSEYKAILEKTLKG